MGKEHLHIERGDIVKTVKGILNPEHEYVCVKPAEGDSRVVSLRDLDPHDSKPYATAEECLILIQKAGTGSRPQRRA